MRSPALEQLRHSKRFGLSLRGILGRLFRHPKNRFLLATKLATNLAVFTSCAVEGDTTYLHDRDARIPNFAENANGIGMDFQPLTWDSPINDTGIFHSPGADQGAAAAR